LPTGALSIYENGGNASVWTVGVGSGSLVFLGWDWFDAVPGGGSQDGGWVDVLDRAVRVRAASTVPEPGSLVLLGAALLVLVPVRQRLRS